jgi:hypothetical protein
MVRDWRLADDWDGVGEDRRTDPPALYYPFTTPSNILA